MNSGDWVEGTEKAHVFRAGVDALDFVIQNRLVGTEVFYDFGNARYDFGLPVHL